MEFRPFKPGDIDIYLSWVNQRAIWEVDNSGPYTPRSRADFLEQWERIVAWGRSWFIVVDEREIGYIGFVSGDNDELTEEFFIVIGETTEWGKGYGKAAMQWLFEKARSLGLRRLVGQVLGNNHRALRFYSSLGFDVVGEREPRFEREGVIWGTVVIERAI